MSGAKKEGKMRIRAFPVSYFVLIGTLSVQFINLTVYTQTLVNAHSKHSCAHAVFLKFMFTVLFLQ